MKHETNSKGCGVFREIEDSDGVEGSVGRAEAWQAELYQIQLIRAEHALLSFLRKRASGTLIAEPGILLSALIYWNYYNNPDAKRQLLGHTIYLVSAKGMPFLNPGVTPMADTSADPDAAGVKIGFTVRTLI